MSVYTLPIAQLVERMIELLNELEEKGKMYAETKANYESIEDQKKPYLSILMELSEGSQSFKESKAYCNPSWKEYLEKLSKARIEFYIAQSRYDLVKTKLDALRTIISTRKEEIKKFE